ncbi:spermatogenesis-associated protein 17 isoform X2 [Drosophila sulfurigaster albostrigata]|uniref:spermatogenesis-associated protein 17 isoform X2 n=1 Tax=Drosophila sulfurigaster albostrigata TaxID=89887 RepID=UPI002D21D513|nr:spermatogenesis-associated protein 17 isoform X2 [Drosophila sulfurigaster albostrigata]
MARNVFLDKETKLRQSRLLPEMASSTSKCSTELLCEFNSEWSQSSDITIPRTPTLILDYVQFLAARTIQRHWRGFSSRKSEVDTKKAAITIQRWWRGYQVRGKYMLIMERMLQDRLMDMYNNAATKIQALFRGWWSRQAVHDLSALKRIQRCAAQDLLNCVAYKLHHLLRTHSIPGVYSLRDSKEAAKAYR